MKTVEIAIGLGLVYFLLSLFVTIIMELISTVNKSRGKFLKAAISGMLSSEEAGKTKAVSGTLAHSLNKRIGKFAKNNISKMLLGEIADKTKPGDDTLAGAFYKHPLIKALSSCDDNPIPSYIKDSMFAQVLLDFVTVDKDSGKVSAIGDTINAGTLKILQTLSNDVIRDNKQLKEKVMEWYNDTMDRVNGWYARRTKKITFCIGIAVAISLNANTINITQKLNNDAAARQAVVNYASAISKDTSWKHIATTGSADAAKQTNTLVNKLSALYTNDIETTSKLLGMGWPKSLNICKFIKWICKFRFLLSCLGWFLTALAISFGAPFWFDLLNKFIQIRGNGANPDEKKKTAPAAAPAAKP